MNGNNQCRCRNRETGWSERQSKSLDQFLTEREEKNYARVNKILTNCVYEEKNDEYNKILDKTEEKSRDPEDRLERFKKTKLRTRIRRSLNRARFMETLDLRFARIYLQWQTGLQFPPILKYVLLQTEAELLVRELVIHRLHQHQIRFYCYSLFQSLNLINLSNRYLASRVIKIGYLCLKQVD